MCMLVLELFSVQTNMKHNIRLGGGDDGFHLYTVPVLWCVLICPLTHYWPRTWTFMHTRVQASSPCVCMHTYAGVCICTVHLLHSRWRSVVSPPVEHLEGCQRDEWLPLYRLVLPAGSSLFPSSVPRAPFLLSSTLPHHLHFFSFLLFHFPPSSCNFLSFSMSAFIESHTISLYSLWALPLERAETVQCCRIICYHGLGFFKLTANLDVAWSLWFTG